MVRGDEERGYEKKDASSIKTHEEIMELFEALKTIEARVKNPPISNQDAIEVESGLQQRAPPPLKPEEPGEEYSPIEPSTDISEKIEEKPRRPWLKKQKSREEPAGSTADFFSFLRKKRSEAQEQVVTSEPEVSPQEPPQGRSTFTLQLDSSGNLIGLPRKKPTSEQQKKGWLFGRRKPLEGAVGASEQEPAKGLSGKLKGLVSRFRRKNASEGESSGGVGSKIRGIFRRKSKGET